MKNNIVVRIITYDGIQRVEKLLYTMKECWSDFGNVDIAVVEDPCPRVEVTQKIDEISKCYGVRHLILPEWGDMQRAANKAFESSPDNSWVFIFPDDVVVTKDMLADVDKWISILPDKVAGIHPPYLHFCSTFNSERDGFFKHFNDWWSPYIRVIGGKTDCEVTHLLAGTGFLLKKSVWKELGGFNTDWYGYDHDISRKIWLSTDYIIVRCMTAPGIHLEGAAQADRDHYFEVLRDSIDRVYLSEQKEWATEKFEIRRKEWNDKLKDLKI